MNLGHYGNAFDVYKWSWLIEFAQQAACDHIHYLALQTTAPEELPNCWAEPKLGSEHPPLAGRVAEFFRGEYRLFARREVRPTLERLARLPEQVAGIRMSIDARQYRLSRASNYFDSIQEAEPGAQVLLVIDPDNGLYDSAGTYKGFCRHGSDRHVSIGHARAAVDRVQPRAVTLTQYNTRKKGCFDDLRVAFACVGRDPRAEFRIFRGRVALAMAKPS